MQNRNETEEILYDFNVYFDSLISSTLEYEGKIVIIWNKGNKKRIDSEESLKPARRHTLIAKSINMQIPLFYNKATGMYDNNAKTQVSCYVHDFDYTQAVFIGVVDINLSEIVNSQLDKKGKILPLELELPLERCDYDDTSIKLSITAKKNFKFSRGDKMYEIKHSSSKKPESKDGTFLVLDNDALDNYKENYIESDEEDDEFFIGYSQAKDMSQIRDTVNSNNDSNDMRNKLLLEDYTPGQHKHMNKMEKRIKLIDENFGQPIQTPFKGDTDTVHITQTRDLSRGKKVGSGKKLGSANKVNLNNIQMIDLDKLDESKFDNFDDGNPNRDQTIKQLLSYYQEEINSKINSKVLDDSREIIEDRTLYHENNRISDLYKNSKKEWDQTRQQYSELLTKCEKLTFELKTTKDQYAIECKRKDSEIKDLRDQNKQLSAEVSKLLEYKPKYEALKAENNKLMEYEETLEEQIEALQIKLSTLR